LQAASWNSNSGAASCGAKHRGLRARKTCGARLPRPWTVGLVCRSGLRVPAACSIALSGRVGAYLVNTCFRAQAATRALICPSLVVRAVAASVAAVAAAARAAAVNTWPDPASRTSSMAEAHFSHFAQCSVGRAHWIKSAEPCSCRVSIFLDSPLYDPRRRLWWRRLWWRRWQPRRRQLRRRRLRRRRLRRSRLVLCDFPDTCCRTSESLCAGMSFGKQPITRQCSSGNIWRPSGPYALGSWTWESQRTEDARAR
jgi:hypothetical protein